MCYAYIVLLGLQKHYIAARGAKLHMKCRGAGGRSNKKTNVEESIVY
jgi:hypothetical protein